ncbi:MAG: ATP-binding cassette domain-containing protein [Actinomycetales bacterium]|nr:ATP-binding cassette domain-containing protein [Actinomycetales bacterium]
MDRELRLVGISRSFGDHVALDDVSFTVRPGRTTGFVGANGAGKTTAMRIILGVLAPDAGRVELGGEPLTLPVRARFGYMPEERGLYPKMKVADQLIYLGRVHGLDLATARRNTEALLAELGLADRADDVLHTLSLGNQQRVQVAAALVHDPILLVLDEPFSGLDPIAVDAMGALLRERAAAGVPVLFSSHQLELVERVCDDVVIIDHGRVVAAGEAQELRAARAGRRYRVRVARDGGAPLDAAALAAAVPGATVVDGGNGAAVVDLGTDGDEQALVAAALAQGALRELTPVVPTLAEIFREVVR